MKNEFIPYEQALDLKKLGFDEPCFMIYDNPNSLKAPLYQQAFKFFRDNYKLSCSIDLTDNTRNYYYDFTIYDSKNRDYINEDCFSLAKMFYNNVKYSTYEEVELECLKKLIEIVKINHGK